MQNNSSSLTARRKPPRKLGSLRVLPGDQVLIFDQITQSNVWIIVDDVLTWAGRAKIRSANMSFYFDEGIVIAHRKGGQR